MPCRSAHIGSSRSQMVLVLNGGRGLLLPARGNCRSGRDVSRSSEKAVRVSPRVFLLRGRVLSNASGVVVAVEEEEARNLSMSSSHESTMAALTERRRSGSEAAAGVGWSSGGGEWLKQGNRKVEDSPFVVVATGQCRELRANGKPPALSSGPRPLPPAADDASVSRHLAASESLRIQPATSGELKLLSSEKGKGGRLRGRRKTFIRGPFEDEDEAKRRGEEELAAAAVVAREGNPGMGSNDADDLHGKPSSTVVVDVWRPNGKKSKEGPRRSGQKPAFSSRVLKVLNAIRKVSPAEAEGALDGVVKGRGLWHSEAILAVRALGAERDWERVLVLYHWMGKRHHPVEVPVLAGGGEERGTTGVSPGLRVLQEGESKLLVTVLQVLGKEGRTQEAEALLVALEEEGREIDVYTRTAMIGVMARTGRYDDAIVMFERMRREGRCKPTRVTYNVAMDVYCKKGDSWAEIERLLADMRLDGVDPDLYTFNTILSACSRDGLWEEAEEIFAQMHAAGFMPDSFTYTALLGAHSRAGMHERAEHIAMQMRDAGLPLHIIAWNNIISAHGRAGRCDEAEQCVEAMLAEGVKPDTVTWGALLWAYAQCGRAEEAEGVHARMRAAGCTPNRVTWNTLVAMFGRLGKRDLMMAAFTEMEASGIRPDVITWNIILDSYSNSGLCNEIANVFRDMKRAGVEPDAATYNILIDAYGRCGSPKDALGVFEGMRRAGNRPGLPAYNSLLSAYARAGEYQLAEQVVEDLRADGLEASEITYSSLLHAYANGSQPELVKKLADELLDRRSQPTEDKSGLSFILWKTLVLVFSKCGLVREAEEALAGMTEEGHQPDVQTYNAMITLQRRRSPGAQQISIDHASFYLEQMLEKGVDPDLMTYNCLIASYGREGEPAKAEEMLKRARDAGLAPDTVSYNTMIVAYARAGRVRDAMRVAEAMRDAGVRADSYTYNAFIGNYVRAGLFEEAEKVIHHMRRVRCRPDAVTYNTLVDAYCKLNRFEDAWRFCDWVRKTDPDDGKALELMDRVSKLKTMQQ